MTSLKLAMVALLLGSTLSLPAQAQTVPLTLGAIPPEDVIPLAEGGIEKALAALPAAIEDTLKRSGVPGAAVAVVHGGVIGELCHQATGSRRFAFVHAENGSLTRLVVWPDGGVTLQGFNDVGHL